MTNNKTENVELSKLQTDTMRFCADSQYVSITSLSVIKWVKMQKKKNKNDVFEH